MTSASPPRHTRIAGTGSYLPPRRVTNDDLARQLAAHGIETSDQWIVERTGIRARHFADDGVVCSDLALIAARHALEAASCRAEDVDLIILATSTPDMVFPSTACILQAKLGIFRFLSKKRQSAIASEYIKQLGIKAPDAESPISQLSGGNQQKAMLARWLATSPKMLILDEPTRGIDIGAHAEILKMIEKLCSEGMSLVVIAPLVAWAILVVPTA